MVVRLLPDSPPLAGGPDGAAVRGGVHVPDDPATSQTPETPDDEPWPIGFMVILLLAALYLGWRLVQGVAWVIDKI